MVGNGRQAVRGEMITKRKKSGEKEIKLERHEERDILDAPQEADILKTAWLFGFQAYGCAGTALDIKTSLEPETCPEIPPVSAAPRDDKPLSLRGKRPFGMLAEGWNLSEKPLIQKQN